MATIQISRTPYDHIDLGPQVPFDTDILVEWTVTNTGGSDLVALDIFADSEYIGGVTEIIGYNEEMVLSANAWLRPTAGITYKAVLTRLPLDGPEEEIASHIIPVSLVAAPETALPALPAIGAPTVGGISYFVPDDEELALLQKYYPDLDPLKLQANQAGMMLVAARKKELQEEAGLPPQETTLQETTVTGIAWTEAELAFIEEHGLVNPTKASVRNFIRALAQQAKDEQDRIEREQRQQQQRELDLEEEREFARAEAENQRQAIERARIRQEENELREREQREEREFQRQLKIQEAKERREADERREMQDRAEREFQKQQDDIRRAKERREADERREMQDRIEREQAEQLERLQREKEAADRRAERDLERYREEQEFQRELDRQQRERDEKIRRATTYAGWGIAQDDDDDDDDNGYRGGGTVTREASDKLSSKVEKVSGTSGTYEAKDTGGGHDWDSWE